MDRKALRSAAFTGLPERLLSSPAENPQEEEEEVDEIQVQLQGTEDGKAHVIRLGQAVSVLVAPAFDDLGVVGGQADKHGHADVGNNPVQDLAAQEEVYQGGDDNPPQPHDQIVTDAGEVSPGGHGVQAHTGEGSRGDEKYC